MGDMQGVEGWVRSIQALPDVSHQYVWGPQTPVPWALGFYGEFNVWTLLIKSLAFPSPWHQPFSHIVGCPSNQSPFWNHPGETPSTRHVITEQIDIYHVRDSKEPHNCVAGMR